MGRGDSHSHVTGRTVSRWLPKTEAQSWYLGFVVDRVALELVSLGTLVSPVSCHSTSCTLMNHSVICAIQC
jgi:hypothetical protein